MTLECFFESYFNLIYNSNPERPNSLKLVYTKIGAIVMLSTLKW